jgi:hypothetical protein
LIAHLGTTPGAERLIDNDAAPTVKGGAGAGIDPCRRDRALILDECRLAAYYHAKTKRVD